MARPREFDEDEVLDALMSVFWSRGFDATSIQHLVDASGIGRASLYGAFGDKAQIFEHVLERYVEKTERVREEVLREPSATRAIQKLFTNSLTSSCPRSGPKGCLLLIATADSESDETWIRDLTLEQLKKSEDGLAELIARGQRDGEFDRAHDARAFARMLVVLLQGLAASARAGWSRDRLSGVLDGALETLQGRAAKATASRKA